MQIWNQTIWVKCQTCCILYVQTWEKLSFFSPFLMWTMWESASWIIKRIKWFIICKVLKQCLADISKICNSYLTLKSNYESVCILVSVQEKSSVFAPVAWPHTARRQWQKQDKYNIKYNEGDCIKRIYYKINN